MVLTGSVRSRSCLSVGKLQTTSGKEGSTLWPADVLFLLATAFRK